MKTLHAQTFSAYLMHEVGVIHWPSKGLQPLSTFRQKRITENTKSADGNRQEDGGAEKEDKQCDATKKDNGENE